MLTNNPLLEDLIRWTEKLSSSYPYVFLSNQKHANLLCAYLHANNIAYKKIHHSNGITEITTKIDNQE